MKIPEFNKKGRLPDGIHICSGNEFLGKFCQDSRQKFVKPISDILDFAKDRGAIHLFVGGSFITSNNEPNDFDCVMVFQKDKYIPSNTEKISIQGLKFDILYASLESTYLIDSYIKLFSTGRFGMENIGIIQIDLYDENNVWEIRHQPDEESFEIIKKVYNHRSLINMNEKKGLLVSVHGLLSHGSWNMDIAPAASSQGWIIAPYMYETNKPDLLFRKGKRSKVVDSFREWIYDLSKKYDQKVSIIAHSFGTFIVGSYLEGFDEDKFPPVSFNSVILTGSILNSNFDWNKHRGRSVGKVLNMIAPNDEFVKYMPQTTLKSYIGMSNLFGTAGVDGFQDDFPNVTQIKCKIFNHTNTIRRDIIETKWLPFLNANQDSLMYEYWRKNQIKK